MTAERIKLIVNGILAGTCSGASFRQDPVEDVVEELMTDSPVVIIKPENPRIEITGFEPLVLYDWVKRLGQWHLFQGDDSCTICGMPMLGNNYAKIIPKDQRTKCEKCFTCQSLTTIYQER